MSEENTQEVNQAIEAIKTEAHGELCIATGEVAYGSMKEAFWRAELLGGPKAAALILADLNMITCELEDALRRSCEAHGIIFDEVMLHVIQRFKEASGVEEEEGDRDQGTPEGNSQEGGK